MKKLIRMVKETICIIKLRIYCGKACNGLVKFMRVVNNEMPDFGKDLEKFSTFIDEMEIELQEEFADEPKEELDTIKFIFKPIYKMKRDFERLSAG